MTAELTFIWPYSPEREDPEILKARWPDPESRGRILAGLFGKGLCPLCEGHRDESSRVVLSSGRSHQITGEHFFAVVNIALVNELKMV